MHNHHNTMWCACNMYVSTFEVTYLSALQPDILQIIVDLSLFIDASEKPSTRRRKRLRVRITALHILSKHNVFLDNMNCGAIVFMVHKQCQKYVIFSIIVNKMLYCKFFKLFTWDGITLTLTLHYSPRLEFMIDL